MKTGFICLRIGSGMMKSCEHGNESSGSIKDGKSIGQLIDYQLFKKISAF